MGLRSGRPSMTRERAARLGAALGLLVLSVAAFELRKEFIRSFFRPGPPVVAVAAEPDSPAVGASLPAVPFLRVALLDGLGADAARGLPGLDALCAGGLDLDLDVGFPTVSLPVQAAFWSARSQARTGPMFQNSRLVAPPPGALPGAIPGSRAVAEAHPEIIASFGFTIAEPPVPPDLEPPAPLALSWSAEQFERAAQQAVQSDARLAFVHVLRIDQAGHQAGAGSPSYREAARWSDDLLGRLVAADRHVHGATARWVVLADHGHLLTGGHGDAEPPLRWVRACLFGALPDALRGARGSVRLPDLGRLAFDSLGVVPPPDSDGRLLAAVLAKASGGGPALLPRPTASRWAVAILLALAGAALGVAGAGAGWRRAPCPWWLVASASAVIFLGFPSLSRNFVFRFWPTALALPALPGLALLVATDGRALLMGRGRAALRRALALPIGLTAAALVLCGGEAVIGLATGPPLVPFATGIASAWLALLAMGALSLLPLALAGAFRAGSGRSGPSGTIDRAA
ncbi:MAG: hypothetical protein EXR72_14635 [Myxococcales bacterium]|nr:hypothetical protein [Myxococcales bacterium]